MLTFDVLYFYRDCPVQWPLKLAADVEVIPVGELYRIHEAVFLKDFCLSNADFLRAACGAGTLPDVDPQAFARDPMCRTPIFLVMLRNVRAMSVEEITEVTAPLRADVVALLSHYWKQAPVEFAVLAFEKDSGRWYWRLIENRVRRVINLPFGSPDQELGAVLEEMRSNPTLRHWFHLYQEAVREQNRDYKWFKLVSLLEIMGNYLHSVGRAPKDTKQSMRAVYDQLQLARPKKVGAYDGIDVAYRHRHCSAHWGGCNPEAVPDCKEWCRSWSAEADQLLLDLEHDLWFILRHSVALSRRT